MVSLIEGLAGTEVVLWENPGLEPAAEVCGAGTLCGLGFEGCSIKRSCCFLSRVDMILENALAMRSGGRE